MAETPRLIYVHDPMCSWCWGFRPALGRLRAQLPTHIKFERLLGGLAEDSEQPMPIDLQRHLQETWRNIQRRIPGTRFNFDFWQRCQPRRSTWPACRAVIAARTLDPGLESPMIRAIQEAYYLEARNPSDDSTLIALSQGLGLDGTAFAALLDAPDTRQSLANEISQARAMGADSFPSLRLCMAGGIWRIAVDYTDADAMHQTIVTLLESGSGLTRS